MELYLFFAAALLLPFGGQLALLRLGRARPRLRFARWLLLTIPAVFFLLAAQAHRGPSFASDLLALFYLISALCSLAGYGLGWLGEVIVKRRDDK